MNVAIKTPIHQSVFELDPASQSALKLTDEVTWSFSILFGRCGGRQIPILSDTSGNLMISDASGALAELYGQLTSADKEASPLWANNESLAAHNQQTGITVSLIERHLESANDEVSLADYFDSTLAKEPLWYNTRCVAELIEGIFLILTDVYDPINHWLRTLEIPLA